MVAVPYQELSLAFEFVSSAAPTMNGAYICLDTGKIYLTSMFDTIDEDAPEDLDTSDRYLPVPHKNDLDLGKTLALRFAAQELAQSYERVADIFRRQGAYRRFKDLLETHGLLEKWYCFEEEAMERGLREWCAENDIQIVEDGEQGAA